MLGEHVQDSHSYIYRLRKYERQRYLYKPGSKNDPNRVPDFIQSVFVPMHS